MSKSIANVAMWMVWVGGHLRIAVERMITVVVDQEPDYLSRDAGLLRKPGEMAEAGRVSTEGWTSHPSPIALGRMRFLQQKPG